MYWFVVQHTKFKVVEILKANIGVVSGFMFYITFKAEDSNTGKTETFQSRVWSKIPGPNGEDRVSVGSRLRLMGLWRNNKFQLLRYRYSGKAAPKRAKSGEEAAPETFDVEKFNGKIDFGLWQINMKDLLIQLETHKALKGKPTNNDYGKVCSSMSDEDWENLDLRAASSIRFALAKNVLPNVKGISDAKEIWEKLEALYQGKGILSRLNLKEHFHTLRMDEGSRISDHETPPTRLGRKPDRDCL
ncbi:hypothetical protein GQ457_08G022280 [Hibiscus cannabinus]